MADAAYQGQPDGANLVEWPSMSSRVVAYIIWRDTNLQAPVALVPGSQTSYIDSATPLGAGNMLESTTWTISIDPVLGVILQFNPTVTDSTSLAELGDANESFSETSFTITAQRVPLSAGQACGYQISVLYMDYLQNGLTGQNGLPEDYSLYLGNKSAVSEHPTLIPPPTLISPASGSTPSNGLYSCQTVPSGTSYVLQVSTSPTFPQSATYSVLATILGSSTAQASFTQSQLESTFPNAGGQMIYWRMGARIDYSVLPFSYDTANADGWVFSPLQTYQDPGAPLAADGETKEVGGSE